MFRVMNAIPKFSGLGKVTFAKQSDLMLVIVLMDRVVQVCLLSGSVTVDHTSCICHKGVGYPHDPNPAYGPGLGGLVCSHL